MAGVRVTIYREELLAEARRLSTDRRVEIAHEAAGDAVADAPVLSGDYRDGIHVETDGDRVSIVDDDPDAIYKEYGTSDTPAHMTLTEAASRYGKYTGWQARGR
ncbi:HK97 gp10 family phage protein [Amycolatopsis sp. NPDC049159]|uniref:HK97 gp10 family phage protein n=1 Tax=Amycolatopsis sp. NPDC049159 TaxID=3157210 RepID=UPI00340A7B61